MWFLDELGHQWMSVYNKLKSYHVVVEKFCNWNKLLASYPMLVLVKLVEILRELKEIVCWSISPQDIYKSAFKSYGVL